MAPKRARALRPPPAIAPPQHLCRISKRFATKCARFCAPLNRQPDFRQTGRRDSSRSQTNIMRGRVLLRVTGSPGCIALDVRTADVRIRRSTTYVGQRDRTSSMDGMDDMAPRRETDNAAAWHAIRTASGNGVSRKQADRQ